MKLTSRKVLVLSESRVGFKYSSIWERLPDVEVQEGGFADLCAAGMRNYGTHKIVYHIRYLKRGPWSLPRYLIVGLLRSLGLIRVLWSCHNIKEHNFESDAFNSFVNTAIARMADAIIVFHPQVKLALSTAIQQKVVASNFGDMKPFITGQREKNVLFANWLEKFALSKDSRFLLSVSAAKKNNLSIAIQGLGLTSFPGVFVAPHVEPPVEVNSEKVLFFNSGFVKKEVHDLIERNPIGYVGHDNVSVPTSLYMFASFGVPVIGYSVEPVKSIIADYKIGLAVEDAEGFARAFEKIHGEYDSFSKNCRAFLELNSWGKAAKDHEKVLADLW